MEPEKKPATECPICHIPINQKKLQYWEHPASSCGSDACVQEMKRLDQNERAARAREKRRKQRNEDIERQRQRLEAFCLTLQDEFAGIDLEDTYGLKIAVTIMEMIENERRIAARSFCQHDDIGTILEHAAQCQRRAEHIEQHNQELRDHISRLEGDIARYQTRENSMIQGVAEEQIHKQSAYVERLE